MAIAGVRSFRLGSPGNPSRFVIDRLRSLDRRLYDRIEVGEPVSLRTRYSEMSGCLINLSAWGAAVHIASGLVPGLGEEISFKVVDGKHLWGRSCRIDNGIIVIGFPIAVEEFRELSWIELRGSAVYLNRSR